MDGFAVSGVALVAAAEAVGVLALDVQLAGVGTPIARLAAVLPGSATAAAADGLAARWDATRHALAAVMAQHGAHLADAAAHYEGTDASVADRLGTG